MMASATDADARRERGRMPAAASDQVSNEAGASVPPSRFVAYPTVSSVKACEGRSAVILAALPDLTGFLPHSVSITPRLSRYIHELSVERDCAESQSQQHPRLDVTPNLLRLMLRTQPRSGSPTKFNRQLVDALVCYFTKKRH